MITIEKLENAIADIKADTEWVNDSKTEYEYKGVCDGVDMLLNHFKELQNFKEEQNDNRTR